MNASQIAGVVLTGCLAIASLAFGEDVARKTRTEVKPVYPELARRMNVAGTVKIQVTIAPNGNVVGTRVIGGHPLLVEPSLEAAKRMRFEPTSFESTQIVEFKFSQFQ